MIKQLTMKPLLCVFISLLIIGSTYAETKKLVTEADCKEGERFLECGTCEPTCYAMPMCTMQCREPMCACDVDKVRNPEGKCVLQSECEPLNSTNPIAPVAPVLPAPSMQTPACQENEGVKHCSGCEPTCDTPRPFCTKICRQLNICECLPNFYRHGETKRCVPSEKCPEGSGARLPIFEHPNNDTECAANEVLKQCSGCENQCGRPAIMCKMICNNIPKCECDQGFFRNNETGECVPQKQCPTSSSNSDDGKCGKNEYLKSCPGCEPTCDNQNPICPMICRLGQECQCKPGFLRNAKGKCVKPTKCPKKKCGENETLKSCPGCEPSCENPNPICMEMCRTGQECECSNGFVRNDEGKCVSQTECQNTRNPRDNGSQPDDGSDKKCDEHEVLTSCPGCEPSCTKKNPICALACREGKECQCSKGFYRNSAGKCVTENECDIENPPSPGSNNCRQNEKFLDCGSCEASCTEHNPMCTMDCKPAGCYCVAGSGFVRGPNGDCIHPSLCQNSNGNGTYDGSYDPCIATTCPVGSICVKQQVQCIRAPCPPQGRCVAPEPRPTRSTDDGVPTNPCAAMLCPFNTRCEVQQVQCFAPPCPPMAHCVPMNEPRPSRATPALDKCATMLCTADSTCQNGKCVPIDGNRPPRAEDDIQISDPCASMECVTGTRCERLTVNCLVAPCPPQGHCVPIDESSTDSPPTLTCANVRCAADHVCKMEQVQCVRAPCPPRPHCVPVHETETPNDPCMTVKCTATTQCINGKCVPNDTIDDIQISDPCATMKCAAGTQCERLTINCFVAPCPPQAHCVPINETSTPRPTRSADDIIASDPCATIRCRGGMVCSKILVNCLRTSEACRPRGVCVPADANGKPSVVRPSRSPENAGNEDPCALIDCRSGMRCSVIMPDCIDGATDCGPRGVCNPIDPNEEPVTAVLPPAKDDPIEEIQNNFCMRARCAGSCITTGIKCNEDGSECEYTGACAPSNNNITGLDVCENSTCPTGKVCEAQVVQCFAAPCPPIPRCVDPSSANSDVCANYQCPANQECRELRLRCNRIVKNCKPLPMCVNKKQ